jgi:hypothetical protein
MAKKCCFKKCLMNFFGGEEKMKTREDKRMVKLEFSFKVAYFGHML